MSYSQNSETTPSRQLEVKNFEKYGMEFRYGVTIHTQPEWESVGVMTDGVMLVDWRLTGNLIESSYVEYAMIKDVDFCASGKSIEVYSTADGPILGISFEETEQDLVLVDPCVVMFDSVSAKIKLMPIFNVARKLRLKKTAIRAVQAPAELLIAAYPGFLINNRMSKYQLKPSVPLAITPELTNSAS